MNEHYTEEQDSRKSRIRRQRTLRTQKLYKTVAILFILCLLISGIANILKPDTSFSEAENRILSQMPAVSLSAIADGSFMTDFESYISDQFFLRDDWISLKLLQDKILGKKESNGVYLGKQGYLLEIPDSPNKESLSNNLTAIRDFSTRYSNLDMDMALAPNSFYILKDKLPSNAPVRDQRKDLETIQEGVGVGVEFLDLITPLQEHANEYIYYKTDHHWTTLGAYYAFQAMAGGMGIASPIQDYDVYTVTNSFYGTLASKSGYHISKDSVQVYSPSTGEAEYVVTYGDSQDKTATVYNSASLKEKDKYTVFFGGNQALVDIETTNADTRRLLIFKDSYANCLIPFLIPYYREIVIIDPRYYYESIDQIISRKNITDVLFLYNINTFLTDSSLADTLAADVLTSSQEENNSGQDAANLSEEEGSYENT